jgi:CHASE3 domain sensor protein
MSMDDSKFQAALELYRTNYLEYKLTGQVAYKEAYERAQAVIQEYLQNLQAKVNNDASYVDTFVKDYANANQTLMELRDKSQQIQKSGPLLEQQYVVQKRLGETTTRVDYSAYYVKAGIIVAGLGIAYVASTLR